MAKRVLTIVGARPQFIKAAVVSHEIAKRDDIEEELVHTGQHFDPSMSQTFFDELSIPEPVMNLGISGGSHAQMTARMLEALESVMVERRPDCVLLFGDTNSTLAGALSAAKLHIPLVHVEAGARTRCMENPEEINRLCADHVSTLLLACTQDSLLNLQQEGLGERSSFVGDPMYDAFVEYSRVARRPRLLNLESGEPVALPASYLYLTCHREENTADPETLLNILCTLNELASRVVYPVHPRNRDNALSVKKDAGLDNILLTEPVGYLESLFLVDHADAIVTDSGGLQREAFFAEKKCVTLLDFEVWPETMVDGRNVLAKPERSSIMDALSVQQSINVAYKPFGDGHAAVKIVDAIMSL